MLSDKEITVVIDECNSSSSDLFSRLLTFFVDTLNDENSSRKNIVDGLFELQSDCLAICEHSLSSMYREGYKKGYEDALLESSGFRNIVDKSIKNC